MASDRLPKRGRGHASTAAGFDDTEALSTKIAAWLAREGYDLEFRTAHAFSQYKYLIIRQGYHLPDSASGKPREIDVVAGTVNGRGDLGVTIAQLVECKSSPEKPILVFTSPHGGDATPETQMRTLEGTVAGRPLAWLLSHDPAINRSPLFRAPHRVGFGGRQAFSSGSDLFYACMQSLSAAAAAYATRVDAIPGEPGIAACVLPLLVVEAPLFEIYYDSQARRTIIARQNFLRVMWEGHLPGTHRLIDVVTAEYLTRLLRTRCRQVLMFGEAMAEAYLAVELRRRDGTLYPWLVERNSAPETIPDYFA